MEGRVAIVTDAGVDAVDAAASSRGCRCRADIFVSSGGALDERRFRLRALRRTAHGSSKF
jgi:hypothetical protein